MGVPIGLAALKLKASFKPESGDAEVLVGIMFFQSLAMLNGGFMILCAHSIYMLLGLPPITEDWLAVGLTVVVVGGIMTVGFLIIGRLAKVDVGSRPIGLVFSLRPRNA